MDVDRKRDEKLMTKNMKWYFNGVSVSPAGVTNRKSNKTCRKKFIFTVKTERMEFVRRLESLPVEWL